MQVRRTTAVTAAALSLALVASCTSHGATPAAVTSAGVPTTTSAADSVTPAPSETPTPTPTPTPTTTPPPVVIASLSGLPDTQNKPAIAVKIENTRPGRPQWGLNDADLVYVEQVEGGITRLMAVFQSKLPSKVGAVRSGRESDLEILADYGKVGLMYSGAQSGVTRLIQRANLVAEEEDGRSYFMRDWSRHAPYNLYVNPAAYLKAHSKIAVPHDIGLHHSATLAGGTPATRATVMMSRSVSMAWTYDAKHHVWLETQSGVPNVLANGQRASTQNVLFQFVTVGGSRFRDVNRNVTPYSHTVGSGTFVLLRPDGTKYTGTWSRKSKSAPTVYKNAAGEVTAAPGRTWILLVAKGNKLTVS